MPWPHITAGYLAVLALIYTALAVNVVRLRNSNRAAFGDAGNPALRSARRAPGLAADASGRHVRQADVAAVSHLPHRRHVAHDDRAGLLRRHDPFAAVAGRVAQWLVMAHRMTN
jgi:hypothetical protein